MAAPPPPAHLLVPGGHQADAPCAEIWLRFAAWHAWYISVLEAPPRECSWRGPWPSTHELHSCSRFNLPPPAAPTLLALTAGLWRGLSLQADASSAADLTSQASLLSGGSTRRPPGMARRVASGPDVGGSSGLERTGSGMAAAGSRGSLDAGGSGACCGAEQEASGHSVLLMGVASDGQVWQWQLPLLGGTLPDAKPPALPPAPKPELLGAGVGWLGCRVWHAMRRFVARGRGAGGVPACTRRPARIALHVACAVTSTALYIATPHRPAAHAAPARDGVQRKPRPSAAACGAGRGGAGGRSHGCRWDGCAYGRAGRQAVCSNVLVEVANTSQQIAVC